MQHLEGSGTPVLYKGRTVLKGLVFTYLCMKMEQCVPKRRHIKFRCQGITHTETSNIQNTAKV
jgi:hypothetical protein